MVRSQEFDVVDGSCEVWATDRASREEMMKRRKLMVAGASAVGLAGFAPAALGQKLPSTSVWTSYDLGSSGYAAASGTPMR